MLYCEKTLISFILIISFTGTNWCFCFLKGVHEVMQINPSITLTLEQRRLILELMNYSYTIPEEYHECVAEAIKKYATKSYSDEAIQKMVCKSQSVANSGFLLREDSMSLFRGKFAEWLACIEYNSLKNSGSAIMTIINPDETSKADLLHFIKVGDEFKAVAGPDIKSGGSSYVFNQWKKIVTSRHDIPMVDFDGVLTTDTGLQKLTKKQQVEFDELSAKYPRKKPIPSAWTTQDELRLRIDYFKNILAIEGTFEYTPNIVPLLKEALVKQSQTNLPESDWTEFNNKCKKIFEDVIFDGVIAEEPGSSIGSNNTVTDNTEIKELPASNINTKKVDLKSIFKKVSTSQHLKKVLIVGGSIAGAAYIAKNPDLGKKIFVSITNLLNETKSSKNYMNGSSNTNIQIPKLLSINNFESEISVDTLLDINDKLPRKSPSPHTVSGYTRKNGTQVASYPRGKND